jgi:glycine cleavage system H protein
MSLPSDLKYTKTHEWIRVEGDVITVGITDHAQSELGDVVFLELPEPGLALGAEESFAKVESVKAVSDIYAPAAGEVLEVNASLAATPELVNSDPYTDGWLVKIRVSDPSALEGFLSPEEYESSLN